MFVAIQLIISELKHALPRINSLLSTAKLWLRLHFTSWCSDNIRWVGQNYRHLHRVFS